MSVLVVGIAGGTGSGKTTLAKKIGEVFPDDVSILYYDNYYKSHDDIPLEERADLNYDHPDAFDVSLVCEQINMLKENREIECPTYDYTVHNRSNETIRIAPSSVVIIEGIMVLAEPRLRELCDIKIFVDTDADERILRRAVRDVEKRGRTMRSVVEQYLSTVKPMHNLFVEPSRKFADIVVPDGGKNPVALKIIISRLKSHIDEESRV